MQINSGLKLLLCGASLLVILSGCVKKDSDTSGADGTLPSSNTGDNVNLNDPNGVALAPRPPDGFNPDKDVDYQTLQGDTIYFAFDSSVIPPGERPKLDIVAQWIKDNPGRSLFLAGHTDKRGTAEYNRGLGERRADSVREYLIGLGLGGNQLQTISYGSDRPVATGDSEEDYAKNRRVEVGIIKSTQVQ